VVGPDGTSDRQGYGRRTMVGNRELAPETWEHYFDAMSSELFNAEVSIEIVGTSEPKLVEADRLALQTLTYDRRDDVFEIACARGGAYLPSVLRHVVDHPQRIAVDSPTSMAPTTIAVDDPEGVRTLVRIQRAAAFGG